MARFLASKTGFLNGNMIISAELTHNRQMLDVFDYESSFIPMAVSGIPSISMSMRLLMNNYTVPDIGVPLVGLGAGYICHHCQSYTPRGKYICMNCGAPLVKKDFIRPFSFPFVCTGHLCDHSVDDLMVYTLDFEAIGPVTFDATSSDMFFANNIALSGASEYVQIMDNYYLCDYCGTATPDGERCEACDGKRLPFRELVDMEHECSYCGNKTVNGIVCDQCGGRMGGVSLSDALGYDSLGPFYET